VDAKDPRDPCLGLQSQPANAGHPKSEKEVPPNNEKYNKRKMKSHNRHHQRPRCPSASRPITGKNHIPDLSAGRGQRRTHESRPATGTADPTAMYATPQGRTASTGPQQSHVCMPIQVTRRSCKPTRRAGILPKGGVRCFQWLKCGTLSTVWGSKCSLRADEWYHANMRQVYLRVKADHHDVPPAAVLSLTLSAMNLTVDHLGLSSTLLAFVFVPLIRVMTVRLPAEQDRIVVVPHLHWSPVQIWLD